MDDRTKLIVIFIVLIIILIIMILYGGGNIFAPRTCKTDSQCSGGVCNQGTCVQCAFDSECCGNQTCIEGRCVIPAPGTSGGSGGSTDPPPSSNPPTIGTFCTLEQENFNDGETFILDITTVVTEGDSPIDWSTFVVDSYNVYTEYPVNSNTLGITCGDADEAPFGTNLLSNFAGRSGPCDVPVEGPPGVFTYDVCITPVPLTPFPAASPQTITWTNNLDGTLTVVFASPPGSLAYANTWWEIQYTFFTMDGNSYSGTAYFITLINI